MLNLNIFCKGFETFFGFNIILVLILFKYNLINNKEMANGGTGRRARLKIVFRKK